MLTVLPMALVVTRVRVGGLAVSKTTVDVDEDEEHTVSKTAGRIQS
jgi:hypothetical protein